MIGNKRKNDPTPSIEERKDTHYERGIAYLCTRLVRKSFTPGEREAILKGVKNLTEAGMTRQMAFAFMAEFLDSKFFREKIHVSCDTPERKP